MIQKEICIGRENKEFKNRIAFVLYKANFSVLQFVNIYYR
jgi:hypothetical protein